MPEQKYCLMFADMLISMGFHQLCVYVLCKPYEQSSLPIHFTVFIMMGRDASPMCLAHTWAVHKS